MKTKGKCSFCNQLFGKPGMVRHVLSCSKRKERIKFISEQKNTNFFLILVEQEPYWLYMQIPDYCALTHLDDVLRKEWLECCGHLSSFKIKGIIYDCFHDDGEDIFGKMPESMDVKLKDVLKPGVIFTHDYDFGSTTTLRLKVVAHYKEPFSNQISIIAQNEQPEFPCELCGKVSESICAFCHETVCSKCIKKHACESGEYPDAYMLPLVNSPRTGICGYVGKLMRV